MICQQCFSASFTQDLYCTACGAQMRDPDQLIQHLLGKQKELERKHADELQELRRQMSSIQVILKERQARPPVESSEKITPPIQEQEVKKPFKFPDPEPETSPAPDSTIGPERKKQLEQRKKELKTVEKAPEIPSNASREQRPQEVAEPVSATTVVRDEGSSFTDFFEPLHGGVTLVRRVYEKYRSEGKLPILFLTVAGILAMLFGFGYLMQLSFMKMGPYSSVVKIGFGFATAVFLLVSGTRLHRKNEKYKEYASALIGLAISLNYLMVYFMAELSGFPVLSSGLVGFLLILANTVLAIGYALKFETKVIAVLALVGGSLAPFYLNSAGDGRFYFLYLWMLVLGAHIVASRIRWHALNYLAFVLAATLLETVVFAGEVDSVIYSVYYHMFAYLFFFIVLFDKFKLKEDLNTKDLFILAGTVGMLMYNLLVTFESDLISLGLIYMGNAIAVSLVMARFWKSLNRKVKLGMFMVVGSFVGLAIPCLLGEELLGLFWSIEAILLVLLGFVFEIPLVRKEGYVVFVIGAVTLALGSVELAERWDDTILHVGFLHYLTLGMGLMAIWTMGRRYAHMHTPLEKFIYSSLLEILPLWMSSVALILAWEYLGEWMLVMALPAGIGVLYWGKVFESKSSALLGILHIALMILGVQSSVIQSGSFFFSDQTVLGQTLIVELIFTFWFVRWFTEKLNINDTSTLHLPTIMRAVFWAILPLIIIEEVNDHMSMFAIEAIWVAWVVSYLLFKVVGNQLLYVEGGLLLLVAMAFSYGFMDETAMLIGVIALLAVGITERVMEKKHLRESSQYYYLIITPYIVSFFASIMYYRHVEDNLGTTLVLFNTLIYLTVLFKDYVQEFKDTYKVNIILGAFFGLAGMLGTESSMPGTVMVVANAIMAGVFVFRRNAWFSYQKEMALWSFYAVVYQLYCVASYCAVIVFIGQPVDGPITTLAFTTHAVVLLFMALRRRIKFMNKVSLIMFALATVKVVFHDTRDFSGADKVIVLIILGVILLAAAYGYVRVKKRFEDMDAEQSLDAMSETIEEPLERS